MPLLRCHLSFSRRHCAILLTNPIPGGASNMPHRAPVEARTNGWQRHITQLCMRVHLTSQENFLCWGARKYQGMYFTAQLNREREQCTEFRYKCTHTDRWGWYVILYIYVHYIHIFIFLLFIKGSNFLSEIYFHAMIAHFSTVFASELFTGF